MPADSALVLRFTALGAIAFVSACVAHEAIGHGGVCLLTGGNVELLSSVFFRCSPGSHLIDAAGPLMNLSLAAIALFALRSWQWSGTSSAFIALLLAFNAMWGAGYLPYSAITGVGDWAFLIGSHGPLSHWIWRVFIALVGLWLYIRTIQVVAPFVPDGAPLLAAYLAGGAVALTSVLLYSGPLLPAVHDAFLEGVLAPIGVLFLTLSRRRNALSSSVLLADVPGRWFWPCVLGIVVAFLLLMGRGYGTA